VIFAPPTPLSWRLAILVFITAIAGVAYAARNSIGLQGQALAGLVFFFGIVAAFSSNLRAVNWKTIGWGIILQLTLAVLVLNNGRPYQIVAGICMVAIVYMWASTHYLPAIAGKPIRWGGYIGGLVTIAVAFYIFYIEGVRASFEKVGDV